MSIIHEALKKVQSDRSETKTIKDPPARIAGPTNKNVASPADKTAETSPLSNKPTSFLNMSLWAAVITILCGFTLYNLYELRTRASELASAKLPPASVQPLSVAATNATALPIAPPVQPAEPAVKLAKPKKGEILLSGIVLMDGKNFALINNEFYEEGEQVEGAVITRITDDSVDILQKGKTRTIKVIRPE